MRAPCKIDGCGRESRGRGWCSTHWTRWRNHGDPMVVLPHGGHHEKRPCSVSDCGRDAFARTYCTMHYARHKKHGDAGVVEKGGRPLKGDFPSWHAVHKRIGRDRGPAKQYRCVDCGDAAAEWSYDNSDPSELRGPCRGSILAYSLDPNRYVPRCVKCHRNFDNAGAGRVRNERGQYMPDDGLVVTVHAAKYYADDKPGVNVKVRALA